MTTTSNKELLSPKDDERMLLELAAKAGGYIVEYGVDWWNEQDLHLNGNIWNPLTDDGDALRLAVKLNINISYLWDGENDQYDPVVAWNGKVRIEEQTGIDAKLYEYDPYAATRRAIVRAAAMVGESM